MQHSVHKLATVWLATPDPHRKEDRQGLATSDTRGPAMRRSTRGGPERVLRTRRRCPQHCTPRGLHSSRGGRSAPHAAVGLPRTGQSLGHGRCHATSTNEHCTRCGLHSSVRQLACPDGHRDPCQVVCQLHAAARLPQTCRSPGHSVPCQVPRMPPWASPGLAGPGAQTRPATSTSDMGQHSSCQPDLPHRVPALSSRIRFAKSSS